MNIYVLYKQMEKIVKNLFHQENKYNFTIKSIYKRIVKKTNIEKVKRLNFHFVIGLNSLK